MAVDYEAICTENRKRYGTDIARIGPMLLADRYDDRTHFIFELLQNAEDALSKRHLWTGSRSVSFSLTQETMTLSHFGRPFNEKDVRGICGIAESTKDEDSIGRFGIGFKSVYTFTDCPQIHSGSEDFLIRNFVQPAAAERIERRSDETQIVLPLKESDSTAHQEITDGFRNLGPSALLFLRSISEINWSVEGGDNGFYLRDAPEPLDEHVQRTKLIGQQVGQDEIDQDWLVFDRDVFSPGGKHVGCVEVAFALRNDADGPNEWVVVPVAASPLVVFFPTALETNLGYLVQGPYRTTPSRDNVLRNDPWNRSLVRETASLLIDALRWLRDRSMLDTSVLASMPLDRHKFPDGSMFAPLFDAVREALSVEPLVPSHGGGYVPASRAKLARTQELRSLFSPSQASELFGEEVSAWLTGDITPDRTPELRRYVMQELELTEETPATLIPRLNQEFLESQLDDWVLKLYEFLSGQEAVLRRGLDTVPLLRLADGSHVQVRENGKPRAFLPSDIETSFPTIRPAVCASDEAKRFLISLGITEPDPVDDVIWNVLPRYRGVGVSIEDNKYARDIERILTAFNTDSNTQREKFISELRETSFVMVIDAGDGKESLDKPGNTYLATDRFKRLFQGVRDVILVDDKYGCLRGEAIRELLEACGAVRYPRPVLAPDLLNDHERTEIRREAGHEQTSRINDVIEDWILTGFEELTHVLPTLEAEECAERSLLIWESLGDLEERRGHAVFEGEYRWSHYGNYRRKFPAAFIRRLNDVAWVPNEHGELQPTRLVVFEDLGWKPNPFLLTRIQFKPPIIDQLAREAGIDPAALDLLIKFGITSVADLVKRLGIADVAEEELGDGPRSVASAVAGENDDVYGDAADLYGEDMPDIPDGTFDPENGDVVGTTSGSSSSTAGVRNRSGGSGQSGSATTEGLGGRTNRGGGTGGGHSGRRSGSLGGRPFISYVGSHPEEPESDPDGLKQDRRMELESRAIDMIVHGESSLTRADEGNKGFDLFEADDSGSPFRWVEVKSMTGSLNDRPIGMSRAQFDFASAKGDAFWLYVVEYASDNNRARILRIQNPAGKAKTFTFDRGWSTVAKVVSPRQSSVVGEGSTD